MTHRKPHTAIDYEAAIMLSATVAMILAAWAVVGWLA